ncbi:transcriptional regulator, Crp/Fnr family [Thiorhodococcus drewsii AZ1]|uniref:Transcriptional regulator, Crp/Fnr family n=1 Tax=Thiorhodococcus drewsii AZ1 TaxID=765913 RepID=G2E7C7_9GAMM|nr:Crp/Fnr family transcriptional regulator [Thiorhodococcus drewsii]EGV27966.1 transcriptional regulator, Crp/Fnr family [Thiorhodococcus drewsii AZ1]
MHPASLAPTTPRFADDPGINPALAACIESATVRSYPKGAILMSEGDPGGFLLLVLSGRVKVYNSDEKGRALVLDECGPGEILGEIAMDGGTRCASVMTTETTRCAMLSHAELSKRLTADPALAMALIELLIQRARAATHRAKELALANVYQRVARLLESLAQSQAEGDVKVCHGLSRQDIADRVGASRDMVRRVFNTLIEGNYLEVEGRNIRLLKKLPADW